MQAYNKVIRIKAWSRNILVLNLYNNYSESSTIALASRSSSSQLSNCAPFYSWQASGTNIQKISEISTTKNNISNKRKLQKIALKGRARNYNRESTRNTYNGATVEKIQLLKNLY